MTKNPQDKNVNIAIIGAGVSGVYCAWRLKQRHPGFNIVVYEASDRIGGRLLSAEPPGIDNMVAELGGMRILPKTQPLIVALLAHLEKLGHKIDTYPFPVDEPQNIAYLRGMHLRLLDFTAHPDVVPYDLSFIERGNLAGSIIINAIEQIVPGITDEGLTEEERREMARKATFGGRPLHEQGFWNVLLRVISGEAYQLGRDAGGYNSTLSNWNASDAIPWYLSDFGIDPDYKGFKQGFQQVPLTLARLFEDDKGEIFKEMPLRGFDYIRNKKGEPIEGFRLVFDGDNKHKDEKYVVHADQLILAMPRRSLEMLAPESPPLQETKVADLIASVTPRPLFKLFTTYDDPWWRAAGYTDPETGEQVYVQSGRSVTDLPVRQTYYWPTDEGKPSTGGPSMLMASYDDGSNIGFWDGLRPRRHQAWLDHREVPKLEKAFEGTSADPPSEWAKNQAPAPMVHEVARQVATMHGLSYTPEVREAAFRDWGDDPYGGGWNSWNIGVESWKVKKEIVQPLKNTELYICGEAYSDAQGWVEGALQTAEMVLAKLKLAPLGS